jgi:hypothetical protein
MRWVVAATAAAAVVAALVVVDGRGDDRSNTPAGPVDAGAATALASEFVDAVAAYDAERAASFLADDGRIRLRTSTVDAAAMGPQLRWTRAAGWRLMPGRCELESISPPAATVACLYSVHGLGSDRLGRGAFADNILRLTIVDDEIVSGQEDGRAQGFASTMWEPFTSWLLSNHADEAALMYADWPAASQPALTERSARLWERNVDRYVRAVARGVAP